ncbi:MAG TPA: bifunctional glycosyltransferase family 2/GtrA family protein [Oscillospiraceae bacterium]|nr:bifunctional glycosyltransferase family 2/GtrA family protein [Oscillospiraceae bacterium]
MEICAIIPSLNPDEKILEVVKGLKEKNFYRIILVDDGSIDKHYFDILKADCDILTHYKNLGKGRAMKTAFNYYFNEYSDICKGVVVVDGDNQHHPDDVVNCCNELLGNPESLVLGVRNFDEKNVPKSNRMGNKITAWVFKTLCGIQISDTQTGLRAIGNKALLDFMEVKGERFEYETNMLLETKRLDIPINEVNIRTIYIEENKTSHFNPLKDGWSIYKVLVKFMSSSIASTVIDFTVFALTIFAFGFLPEHIKLLIATLTSRVTSSAFNYFLNHKVVFKSKAGIKSSVIKYYTLCTVQMLLSYAGVFAFTSYLNVNELISKIIVDFTLFLISFQIQREWVYKKSKKIGREGNI